MYDFLPDAPFIYYLNECQIPVLLCICQHRWGVKKSLKASISHSFRVTAFQIFPDKMNLNNFCFNFSLLQNIRIAVQCDWPPLECFSQIIQQITGVWKYVFPRYYWYRRNNLPITVTVLSVDVVKRGWNWNGVFLTLF
jgi:hypothetical protein